jgi:hypothetical protein
MPRVTSLAQPAPESHQPLCSQEYYRATRRHARKGTRLALEDRHWEGTLKRFITTMHCLIALAFLSASAFAQQQTPQPTAPHSATSTSARSTDAQPCQQRASWLRSRRIPHAL